jgi:hypothetical protein
MPALKEPHYFAVDLDGYPRIRDLEAYLALFSAAPPNALTGEASVWYLYSQVAVPRLMAARPDARLIIMLRNPLDMAPSLHQQQVIGLTEDILDFNEAWRAQDERARGHRIPVHCTEPLLIQYGPICRVAEQVERVMKLVPSTQLLILLYEEFFAEPARHYQRVQEFLGLPPEARTAFERINAAGSPGRAWIYRLLARPPRLLRWPYVALRKLSQTFGLRLGRVAVRLMNVQAHERAPLSAAMKRELSAYFGDDIARLERLLGRPLDIWREQNDTACQPAPVSANSVRVSHG